MSQKKFLFKQIDFSKETRVNAYLDLANMFYWQPTLKWNFSVHEVIKQLLAMSMVKEVRVYYGLNEREIERSKNFHQKMRKTGAIVLTKAVKWIKKDISKNLFVRRTTLDKHFDNNAHSKLDELIMYLQSRQIIIEEAKCNFDVEMAIDMMDAINKVSGIFLFSGDSDLREPLERLKLKSRNVYIFGVRGHVGKELWEVCTKYVDFGQWYRGHKKRKSRS
jgi:uncharacterized LabA/DUF88 family protein